MEIDTLISKCIARDKLAEKEFYYAFAKRVYGICRRYTQDDHEAEDMMQESMHKVFYHLHKYDNQKGSIMTWISTITVNTVLSSMSNAKYKFRYENVSNIGDSIVAKRSDQDMSDITVNGISAEDLLQAIRKLPKEYRDVINLYVFENWSHDAIANVLDIKESSSRSKLTRAKKILKEILSDKRQKYYEGAI